MNQQVGHPFWNVVKDGVFDACERYNFECVMEGPTGMDNPAMITMIEAAIATGEYDGMLIPAIVPEMFVPVINEAVDAGIDVITFCTDAPDSKRLAFVGTDGFQAGKAAGEFMVNLVNEKLGGKANINIISGQAAQTDLNDRIDGFKSALVPGLEVTSIDYGEGGIKDTLPKLEARLASIQTSMPSSPPWPTVASPSCQCTLPTQIALTILLWWCLTTRTRHWTAFDKGSSPQRLCNDSTTGVLAPCTC